MGSSPEMLMADPASNPWHIDRRIPAALIAALVLQMAGAIWWGSSINERVASIEGRLTASVDQAARLVRVETILERVERKVDKLAP